MKYIIVSILELLGIFVGLSIAAVLTGSTLTIDILGAALAFYTLLQVNQLKNRKERPRWDPTKRIVPLTEDFIVKPPGVD